MANKKIKDSPAGMDRRYAPALYLKRSRAIMTTQQITAIALRIFSMWLVVQLVLNFPSVIMLLASVESYHQPEILIFVYLEFMSAILLAGFVSAYVIYRVAGKILSMGAPESANTLSLDDQKFLLQIGGFYFIVNALAYPPVLCPTYQTPPTPTFKHLWVARAWHSSCSLGYLW